MLQFFRRIQNTTLCLLGLMGALPFSYAYAGEFTVTDGKADAEISEVSRIYLDGKLVSVIRLDDKNQEKTVKVTTPMGRLDHSYTLCGEITIRSPKAGWKPMKWIAMARSTTRMATIFTLWGLTTLPNFF